jgi:HK97 family phage portal protein
MDKYPYTTYGSGIRKVTLAKVLGSRPNMFMDANAFWRLVYLDLIIEGWAFIHYSEQEQALYHVPAANMEVFADRKKYISKFVYDGKVTYQPDEIIFIRDNSYTNGSVSTIDGRSRFAAALTAVKRKEKLEYFKEKFFDNGTILGLIVETEQNLSPRAKARKREEIRLEHNPRQGKSNVLILDGGAKGKNVQATNLNELGIKDDIERFDNQIALSLGIPPILLEGGNNANIRPNIDLLYYTTVLPMAKKVESALEFFFGFDIKLDTSKILALAPDGKAQSDELSSKVNNGIITGNEAREVLRLEEIDDPLMNEIRIPANVAGSNSHVTGQEGGAPKKE